MVHCCLSATDGEAAEDCQAATPPAAGPDQQGRALPAVPAGSASCQLCPSPAVLSSLAPQINSEYRAEFARCLEPLLMLSPRRSLVGSAGGIGPGITGTNM